MAIPPTAKAVGILAIHFMTLPKIFKNFGFLSLGEIITRLISFFIVIFIARYLGATGLGLYSFVFAFCALLISFSDMGARDFIVRDISRKKELSQKYISNLLVLKILFGLIMAFAVIILINNLGYPQETIHLIYLALAAVLIESLNQFLCTFFWAHEMMQVPVKAYIIERIVAGSIVITLLMLGYNLNIILFAFIFSQIVSFLVLFPTIIKKITKVRLEVDLKFWKEILTMSWPFWITGLFIYIYYRTDIVILQFLKGNEAVGWYSGASKLIDTLTALSQIIILAVFPTLSQLKREAKELYKKTLKFLFTIIFPIAIGCVLLANRVIYFIYRQQFINSAITLQILIWAEVFLFINFIMGYLLNALDMQKLFMKATVICVFINIAFNLILIPFLSFKGSALATVLTQIINFGILYYYTKKEGFGVNIPKLFYKPVLVGIGMGAFIFILKFLPILVLIPLAGLFYIGILYLVKGFDKEMIDKIRGIVL